MLEHRSKVTDEIKQLITIAFTHLNLTDSEFVESYSLFADVSGFPEIERYSDLIRLIQSTKSRAEIATSAVDLFYLAAAEGFARPVKAVSSSEGQTRRVKLAQGSFSIWLDKYDKLKSSGKVPALVLYDAAQEECCPACRMRLPSQVRNKLHSDPATPELCPFCRRILIGLKEA